MNYLRLVTSLVSRAFVSAVACWLAPLALLGLVGSASAAQQEPTTTSVSMPISGWADFLDESQTHVLDSVYLSGEIHFVVQVSASAPDNVQQIKITANLDGVSGTSPRGQRYRAVGSSTVNVSNPAMTVVDNLFTAFPEQLLTFRLHAVDPEPARINGSPVSYSAAVYTNTSPTPVPFICEAIYSNGKLITNYIRCNGGAVLLRPPCCTPVQDESGKVVAWKCPGETYYPGNPESAHLANCSAPSRSTFPLYFEISVFERFHCTGDSCLSK